MFIFLLQQRVIDLERQCWANAQYSRRDCLEVAGIPESVKQNELEDKVFRIFKKVGWIFLVILLKPVIMLKDDCQQIFLVKKDLSKLDMKEVDLPEEKDICKPVCVYNTNHGGKKVKS